MNLTWHKKWERYGERYVLVLWRDEACHMELRFNGESKKVVVAEAKEYIRQLHQFSTWLK